MKLCNIDACTKEYFRKNMCGMHYQRWYRNGDPLKLHKTPPNLYIVCSIEGCNNSHWSKSFCRMHYDRLKKTGEVGPVERLVAKKGEARYERKKDGYIAVSDPKGRGINKHILEHRLVMEEYLGRELLPSESIHHKNGDRKDNRLENLELWSSSQPYGQRIEDKVKWAREIINLYGGGEFL